MQQNMLLLHNSKTVLDVKLTNHHFNSELIHYHDEAALILLGILMIHIKNQYIKLTEFFEHERYNNTLF